MASKGYRPRIDCITNWAMLGFFTRCYCSNTVLARIIDLDRCDVPWKEQLKEREQELPEFLQEYLKELEETK